MKTEFTRSERWYMFWGYVYLLNTHTGEVHWLPGKTAQCGIDNMAAHNKRYLTRKGYHSALKSKNKIAVNGCVWCNKKDDLE